MTLEAKGSLPLQNGSGAGAQPEIKRANDRKTTTTKKPLAFYLGYLGLNINALVFSLDATSLAVAIPVSFLSRAHQPRIRPLLFSLYTKKLIMSHSL